MHSPRADFTRRERDRLCAAVCNDTHELGFNEVLESAATVLEKTVDLEALNKNARHVGKAATPLDAGSASSSSESGVEFVAANLELSIMRPPIRFPLECSLC